MTSSVDISNMALAELGTRSDIVDLSEGSAESIQCLLWYDRCRRQLLRAAPWGFARAQFALSELGNALDGTAPFPWPFKYTYPANALRVHYILPPPPSLNGADVVFIEGSVYPSYCVSRANRFLVANDLDVSNNQRKVLLATLQTAWAVYTIDVTDAGLFDDMFVQAVASLMAYRMCLALTGNAGMRSQFQASVNDAVTSARVADGNEAVPSTDHTPDWIAIRGYSDAYFSGWDGLGQWYAGYDNISWGM